MIILNMQQKSAEVKITETMFDVENNTLTLQASILDGEIPYPLTGKTITASFSPSGKESEILTVTDGIIQLPVYSSYVKGGSNIIHFIFRWGTDKIEISPTIIWNVKSTVKTSGIAQSDVDIVTSLISQLNEAIANTGTGGGDGSVVYIGKSPYIGANGNWYEWNDTNKVFADTGVKAQGPQGIQGIKGDTGAQGIQGVKGDTGANGYTPVKGTDYYTSAEVAQIKSDIEASISTITTISAVSDIYAINVSNKPSVNIAITTADAVAKTVTVANVPTRSEMYLELTYTNAAAITWFSGITWLSGSAPTLTAGKSYRLAFFTSNGGATWNGISVGGW